MRLADKIHILWKRLLSYRKVQWSLADYPIRLKKQSPEQPYVGQRFKTPPYHAQILNWHVSGSGETKEEAIRDLDQSFSERKTKLVNEGKPVPRPGTKVPIEFASQEKTNAFPSLTDDFIHRVLQLEWAWISDESSMWDFHTADNNDEFVARIKEIYDVDVSDIESAKLWQIFERIESKRNAF
ncbi:hypothetical protein ACFPT7_24205 [Acidicapsa dinghuensis]|uniref:Uncharacterized protein n=1 Tax=Acidicapsa dinghuensis TaxID=2218256 RepID=A0ABW1EMD5_9BACT|nr:hypothetical protein [Acidicapsa dinghuensis]